MLRELPTAYFFTANVEKILSKLLVEIMTNEKLMLPNPIATFRGFAAALV